MEITGKAPRQLEKSGKSDSGAAREKRSPASNDHALELLTKIMLDSTPLICAIWDETGQLIDCNSEMLRLLKIKDKTEVMNHFFHFSPERQPDGQLSRKKSMCLIKEALKTGHQHFEWEYRTTDNEPFPTKTSLIRVEWQNMCRLFAYSRDLREVKKAKEQEALAKERETTMLNTLPLATYLISDTFQVIDCNEAAIRLFRANDKQHVINCVFSDFAPQYQPDGKLSSEKAQEYMTRAFLDGRIDFEWNHQSYDGEIIPAWITLIRVPWDSDGYVLSAYTEDLRETKKAEQEIWQQSAFLRTVNRIAQQLLSSNLKNSEKQIEKSMEFLARNMNLHGVKVWMNYEQNEELYYRLYTSWPAEDALMWPGGYAYSSLPFLERSHA